MEQHQRRRQPAFGRDHLLATLTLYWTTRTAASSLLPYWAHGHTPGSALPPDDPPPTPTAIDIFGGEIVPFPKPPRELAERYFRIASWAEHARGGHFPAAPNPSSSQKDCEKPSGPTATSKPIDGYPASA